MIDIVPPKPKLVFFQYRYDERLPLFLILHKEDHARCLSHFFDVTVISHDCDYSEICDLHQPDLVLFEGGVPHPSCRKPALRNVKNNSSVPKLGLMNADAFCQAREGFLSDMEHLGVETFFSIATAAAQYNPEIADHLFIWPNFVNPDIFRDHGEAKTAPILFTGNTSALYPWRRKLLKILPQRYAPKVCPHPGYAPGRSASPFLAGEAYARSLNASWLVPTCGTVAQELVRKHLEIPACRACLVAERTPVMEAAGFLDMQNCIFADDRNILDKVEWLFQNPGELSRITDAGHALVHSRHTAAQRSQIHDWFVLNKGLAANERIVQSGPFGALQLVDAASQTHSGHIESPGAHLGLLSQGKAHLADGDVTRAMAAFSRCLDYVDYMPEPQLQLAICQLRLGNAATALSWITQPIEFTLASYQALDPDPVEWAVYLKCLLCLGRHGEARRRAADFPALRHEELDRTRWGVQLVTRAGQHAPAPGVAADKQRFSIHRLPQRSLDEWLDDLSQLLAANGQSKVSRPPTLHTVQATSTEVVGTTATGRQLALHASAAAQAHFQRKYRMRNYRNRIKVAVRRILHGLEAKHGYFLPYRLSSVRRESFISALREAFQEHTVESALLMGAVAGESCTEAFMAAAAEYNANTCVLHYRRPREVAGSAESNVTGPHRRGPATEADAPFETLFSGVGTKGADSKFDLLLLNLRGLRSPVVLGQGLLDKLHGARYVFVSGTGNLSRYDEETARLLDADFELTLRNSVTHGGYSMFTRHVADSARSGLR